MERKKVWIKGRHRAVFSILGPIITTYARWKYGIKTEPFEAKKDQSYLILMNHQTGFDQFFPLLFFKQPIYFVATEDIFSMGWVSRVIQYLVAPIPIRKQTTDLQAVKNCIRVAREGGSICIAPEGNRTFHGQTVYMKPAIASLAQKLGLPVVLMRIEDGYGVQPRWSDVVRKGSMRCRISRVLEPEECKAMTQEELMEVIRQELWVDEARVTGEFIHSKNAEYLERVVYTCPKCGFSPFESHGDRIHCKTCGLTVRHLPTKELEGVNAQWNHRFVADWYHWQNAYVNETDLRTLTESPVFTDKARLSRVHPGKYKELLKNKVQVSLYGDRMEVDDQVFPFKETDAVVVLGKNKLNIYTGKEILQLKGDKRFNALKYVNFFHRYKNQIAEERSTFLGI